ncbi:MAG: glycosyltransferase [Alphaproteobacteria bacterium]|nr:glycosyltransferase [Alphaproteobacteria bacterium]MDE2111509.1 glycosyltransferase [Alphaproteobacteria bacterium]MDE2493946.1 glycosyltransferase [Alphaproteobacteria bacterium]
MRVLQVIGTLSVGGAESWLIEVLRYWSKSGAVKMDFLLTSGKPGVLDDEIIAQGGRVRYLQYCRRNLGTFARQFRRILREGGYDAIHDHSDYASGWHFLFGIGLLPPVRVMHIHNTRNQFRINYERTAARRLSGWMGRAFAAHLATHVCGTSENVLREYGYDLETPGRPHASVLHCGVDVAAFNGPRAEDRASVLREFSLGEATTLLFHAGRLDYQLEANHPHNHKNTWLVIEIAREALRHSPHIALLVAGAGDRQRAQMEELIAAWGLSNKLRLIGVRRDMARLMRAADIVLFPSTEEGLGMVAVEAQVAGTPVLTSTTVPREACINPKLYHALPLSEPVEAWAKATLGISAASKLCVEECRAIAEASPFSIANSARALESVYGAGRA